LWFGKLSCTLFGNFVRNKETESNLAAAWNPAEIMKNQPEMVVLQ